MCDRRNVKSLPKRSYERGVILIRCECTADHLIADNLGWFDDSESLNIERILLEEKGQKVFKASVLDLNKRIQQPEDINTTQENSNNNNNNNTSQSAADAAAANFIDGKQHLTDDTISPELYNKIQETLRIAREEDRKLSTKI
eukprot:UN03350